MKRKLAMLLILGIISMILPLNGVLAEVGSEWTEHQVAVDMYGTDITYNNGDYVMVGEEGKISTSKDLTNWAIQNSTVSKNLNGVIAGKNCYITVGEEGKILTSPDGIKWTAQESNLEGALYSVAWSGTQYAAVGDSGVIITSPDGIKWTKQVSGTIGSLNSVIWSGTQFVAVGGMGAVITSPDGSEWTPQNAWTDPYPGENKDLASIAWGSGRYVAVSFGGAILTSTDSKKWSIVYDKSESLMDVTWGKSGFVVVGGNDCTLTSSDGINWTDRTPQEETWRVLSSVIWTGEQYITVSKGQTIVFASKDGSSWTQKSVSGFDGLYMVWSNNKYFAFSYSGMVLSSPDAITWTLQDSAVELGINDVVWGNNTFVASGNEGIYTSTDGVKWTLQDVGRPIDSIVVFGTGNKFIAFGNKDDEYICFTSLDGKQWENHDVVLNYNNHPDETFDSFGITWINNRFIGCNTSGSVITSTDGITWTSINAVWRGSDGDIDDPQIQRIIWGNGVYLALSFYNGIYTSKDGIQWNAVKYTDSVVEGMQEDIFSVTYDGNEFIATTNFESLLVSTDGVNWVRKGSAPTGDIIMGGNGFIICGYDGTRYYTSSASGSSTQTPTPSTTPATPTTPPSSEPPAGTSDNQKVLTLTIGKNTMNTSDGTQKTLETAPVIKDARTYLPIRAVVEALGGTLSWDGKTQKIGINQGNTSIEMWVGNSKANVNGKSVPIDSGNPAVAPWISPEGRTMVPVRFVSENLGAKVEFDQKTSTITITYNP